jgi:hypothetical protein
VAVRFAYCTGGPFGLESMISGSGPGLAWTFLNDVPFLLSVPTSLATAEMTTILPVRLAVKWIATLQSKPCRKPSVYRSGEAVCLVHFARRTVMSVG